MTWDEVVEELAWLHLAEREADAEIQRVMRTEKRFPTELVGPRSALERVRSERRRELEAEVGLPPYDGIEEWAARSPMEHELNRRLTKAFTDRSAEMLAAGMTTKEQGELAL